jgi:hypothetical protein
MAKAPVAQNQRAGANSGTCEPVLRLGRKTGLGPLGKHPFVNALMIPPFFPPFPALDIQSNPKRLLMLVWLSVLSAASSLEQGREHQGTRTPRHEKAMRGSVAASWR